MPGEQQVVRVALLEHLANLRGLPVGARRDHQLDDVLDVPATVPEFDREPIQQFSVDRPGALGPEIVQRFDHPLPVVEHPQPVDKDPRRQRVFRSGDPVGQIEPVRPPCFPR